MNRLAAFIVAFIIAALWMLAPAPGITRVQAPAGDRSRSTVEGFVVDSVTGQPIVGMQVAIIEGAQSVSEAGIRSLLDNQRPTIQTPQITKIIPMLVLQGTTLTPGRTTHSVITDAQGKFAFTGVAAGEYVVAFSADGYVYQVYGQKSDSVFVPPTDIHEGRNDLGNVQIRPEQQVSGRIIDPSGRPIASIPVYLLKAEPEVGVDGDKRFRVIGETVTDAAGTYLLKKIIGGRYYIAAGGSGRPEGMIRVSPTPDGGRATERMSALVPYPYTYYPGVPDISLAWSIDVPAGRNIAVKDTVVTVRELRSIRGRVVDRTTGKPPGNLRLVLNGWHPFIRAGSNSKETLSNGKYDRTTGVFEFVDLIPGLYRIDAALPGQQTPGPSDLLLGGDLSPRSAFQLVELTDSDVNNLVLSVPGNGRVTGKVVVSDGKDLPVAESILTIPLQLTFRPVTPLQPAPLTTSVSVRDGTFEVGSALEGKYRFSLVPLRDNYYVSEARVDGVHAANGILDIPKNAASELILTVSAGGEIQGTAVDRKGQPVRQAKGVILPDPLPEIIPFYQTINANNEGRFSAHGIPPGNYRIYVWDGTDPPQVFDRELLARSRALAFPIHVEKGSSLTPTVPILAP